MDADEVATFWGVSVPATGKAVPFVPPPSEAKLHVSQAVLAPGAKANGRSYVRVKVQEASPLVIAVLREGQQEMASVDLVFDEYTEFSVEGDADVHLTGYHMPMNDDEPGMLGDEAEEGEESDEEEYTPEEMQALRKMIMQRGGVPEGMEGDDESEEDSEEDDEQMFAMADGDFSDEEGDSDEDEEGESSDEEGLEPPQRKSTVVIEEMPHEDPIETAQKKRKADTKAMEKPSASKKQQIQEEVATPADKSAQQAAKSAQKAAQSAAKAAAAAAATKTPVTQQKQKQQKGAATPAADARGAAGQATSVATPSTSAKAQADGSAPKSGKKGVRKFPNGLEIADTALGQPDGKLAKAGKRVKVRYVGRLASNGKVFDQTKGNKSFAFRLGVGEVISGWDKGVEGMRVGDKRRLTVPPSMGYGASGAPPTIPGNATLQFDVELVNVM